VWQRPSAWERQAAHVQLLSTPMHKRAGRDAAGLGVITTGSSNRSLQRLSDGSKALQAAEPEQDWDDAKLCGSGPLLRAAQTSPRLLDTDPAAQPRSMSCHQPTATCSRVQRAAALLRDTAIRACICSTIQA